DSVHFGMMRGGDEGGDRHVATGSHHEDAAAVSLGRATHVVTPFFARENEPSPIASSKLMPRLPRTFPSRRSHALRKTPERVQSRCRLQQVAGEGYRSGKSFHRAPVIRTHRMPS